MSASGDRMALRDRFERLGSSLLGLGARRLAALAVVGLSVFGAVAFGSYYLSRPPLETLYIGLSRQDASRIGGVLRDAGMASTSAPTARRSWYPMVKQRRRACCWRRKACPTSANSGYELFDKLGLSRPHLVHAGHHAGARARRRDRPHDPDHERREGGARHIVLPDIGSFRRARQPPSASVIIRTGRRRRECRRQPRSGIWSRPRCRA